MGEEKDDGAGSPGSRISIWSTKWGKHSGGGLGISLPGEHRRKEPLEVPHRLAPGPGQKVPSQGLGEPLRGGEGGDIGLCFFVSFSLFLVLFLLVHPCFLALDHFCTKAS